MKLYDHIKNIFALKGKYKIDSDGVILAAYFNPQHSTKRHELFEEWYSTIKHLPHLIVEGTKPGVITSLPMVPEENKLRVEIKSNLWHKESLINLGLEKIEVMGKHKFVFWLDTDIKFSNLNWFVESCEKLRTEFSFIQPFKYVKHLKEKHKFLEYSTSENNVRLDAIFRINDIQKKVYTTGYESWYSFGYKHSIGESSKEIYELHGHVGMAWGARLEDLSRIKLYDKALIGGADHIMAHAIAGDYCHSCIKKTFGETTEVIDYMYRLAHISKGSLTYTEGIVFHGWHGDLVDRDYFNRIKNHSYELSSKGKKNVDGVYEIDDDSVFTEYMASREIDVYSDDFIEKPKSIDFGGGSFGGGGASGSWVFDEELADKITKTGKGYLLDVDKLSVKESVDIITDITETHKNDQLITQIVGSIGGITVLANEEEYNTFS